MDRQARKDFRNGISDVHWNRERLHPYKWRTQEQVAVHKTRVVGTTLVRWAMDQAEATGNYKQDLHRAQQIYDQVDRQLTVALTGVADGTRRRIGQHKLEAMEKLRKICGEEVDKVKKKRDDAIARELKVGMALYCQKHGLARAEKVAKRQFRRLVWALGVEKANEAMTKLFNDILKAVVEGKLGAGSF